MSGKRQSTKTEKLSHRLSDILHRLVLGERLHVERLAEEYQVGKRTIQKDLNVRLSFLEFEKDARNYYRINTAQFGLLTEEEINRFARFASIQQLFPKIDRTFYQEKLTESIQVKGFHYEDISGKNTEFKQLKKAIEQHRLIEFYYTKNNETQGKMRSLQPYKLLNKNGIWFLLGLERGKRKTFCFSRIKSIFVKTEVFTPDPDFIQQIENSDSISHGNQIAEVVIQVSANAAPYFECRNLLPNQETVRKLDDGSLLLACRNVNTMEVIPIVQYWIPHLKVISPSELQNLMIDKLKIYLIQC
ncbi:helix-turn-helix transcriptional regulator [Basfia succiniciproducens]|uniref:helix-turn-helix transcriptional regulator n=1 Tax=Basfia succiniciproducens TaxID=653940 RepID=UPI0008CC4E75|nr:WYL domain-containing protein [Basfia succiniciproducens]SEP84230.1 Predicted DNA-binding transcriptional regulator YafY, contains an HTH and WYL domains [Basfia succiniciproducens]